MIPPPSATNWNLPTVLTAIGVTLVVTAIVWKMIRDRRAGKRGCNGTCAGCAGCPAGDAWKPRRKPSDKH